MWRYIVINIYIIVAGAILEHCRGRFITPAEDYKIRFVKAYEFVLLAIALILFSGLRGSFTSDHEAYYYAFYDFKNLGLKGLLSAETHMEVGYRYLNKFISIFIEDGNWALFSISAMMVMLVAKEGKRYATSLWLFLLFWVSCGFYYLSFNMVRQALAGAIVFSGTRYLLEKKVLKYCVVVLCAASIHTTALFMFIAIPFLLQPITFKNILRTIVFGIVAIIFLDRIIIYVQQFRYQGYEYGMGNGRITAIVVPLFLMIIIVWVCMERYIDVSNPLNKVLVNATILYGIICIGQLHTEQISRLGYFFSTYTLLLTSNCLCAIKNETLRRIIKFFALLFLTLYVYVWISGTGFENYYTFL